MSKKCAVCGKPLESGVVVHAECARGWIPVTAYEPDTARSVLIYSKSGGIAEGSRSPITGKWLQFRWNSTVKVTHWMPLPEPPEVG